MKILEGEFPEGSKVWYERPRVSWRGPRVPPRDR
jgi:hypothetical protein